MTSPTPLLIASANPHKVDEFRAILAPLAPSFTILGLRDVVAAGHAGFVEPDEIGLTFEHNAAIKALSYAEQSGHMCLADDSGLEIDALGGRPGVISSHYFNDGRTDGLAAGMGRDERDRRNNDRVLRELAGVPFERRGARFVCVLAVARPACGRITPNPLIVQSRHKAGGAAVVPPATRGDSPGLLATFRATFEGRVGFPPRESTDPSLAVPRGDHGFGYDPIFLVAPAFDRTSAELPPQQKNATSHRARAAAQLLAWLSGGGLVDGLSPSRPPPSA